MKRILMVLAILVPDLAFSAGDAEIGKSKSASGAACHGPAGISANPEWPNLAGQKEAYVVSQLMVFRSGERKNALMSPMAANLSDDDIAHLAAFFSTLENQ